MLLETENKIIPLSRMDINAIKKCTSLCIRLKDGVCQMEAHWCPSSSDKIANPFACDQWHIIPVGYHVDIYEKDGPGYSTASKYPNIRAFCQQEREMFSAYSGVTPLIYAMKDGDLIEVNWTLEETKDNICNCYCAVQLKRFSKFDKYVSSTKTIMHYLFKVRSTLLTNSCKMICY